MFGQALVQSVVLIVLTMSQWRNALTGTFKSDCDVPKRRKGPKSERKGGLLGSPQQVD